MSGLDLHNVSPQKFQLDPKIKMTLAVLACAGLPNGFEAFGRGSGLLPDQSRA